jgi:hypothetical protein
MSGDTHIMRPRAILVKPEEATRGGTAMLAGTPVHFVGVRFGVANDAEIPPNVHEHGLISGMIA